jgi:hypothetical protein
MLTHLLQRSYLSAKIFQRLQGSSYRFDYPLIMSSITLKINFKTAFSENSEIQQGQLEFS